MTNRTLRTISAVALAGAAVLATAAPATADSIRDQQWHLKSLKADKLHAITQGEGITVAVIDSGVDAAHPDLKNNVLPGRDFTSGTNPAPHHDGRGHGTAMASLIAAHGHGNDDGVLGIAPRAKILPLKTPEFSDVRARVEAIRWAADQGASVINLSGGSGASATSDEKAAINYALKKDVVIIASAGNTTQHDTGVISPADIPGVIAVSGTNQSGQFTKESVQGPEVVVAAPAADIMSADAGDTHRYESGTGTSNSAAIVSGIVALIRAKYPKLNAASVINRLISTADDKGPKGRDSQYGYGAVNPLAALTEDVPEVDRNPLLPQPTNTPAAAGDDGGTPTGAIIAFSGAGFAALLATIGTIVLIRRNRLSKRKNPQSWPTRT